MTLATEGISSILSVPIVVGGILIGAVRVYTSEPWDFTLDDVNFVQVLAQIAGGAINMARREAQTQRSTRRTPYEGVPISVSSSGDPGKE